MSKAAHAAQDAVPVATSLEAPIKWLASIIVDAHGHLRFVGSELHLAAATLPLMTVDLAERPLA